MFRALTDASLKTVMACYTAITLIMSSSLVVIYGFLPHDAMAGVPSILTSTIVFLTLCAAIFALLSCKEYRSRRSL